MDAELRDLLPTVPTPDRIRKAAKALGIDLNEVAMGSNAMTRERKTTALLAVLSAWITAYQVAHDRHVDTLAPEHLQMLVSSAVSEVTDGDKGPTLAVAAWHTEYAGMLVRELGRDFLDHPDSVAGPLLDLASAMAYLLFSWRASSTSATSMDLGGIAYSTSEATPVVEALGHVQAAAVAITRLLPAQPD